MVDCEPVELLHGVPLFEGLNTEQLAELACRVQRRDFAAGETIFRRGDPGDSWIGTRRYAGYAGYARYAGTRNLILVIFID